MKSLTTWTRSIKEEDCIERISEGVYHHYKGNLYRVICTAKHAEMAEDLVVYQDAIDKDKYWARPASMWNEEVDVDGRKQPRF